jgi:putative heme-binding domain-containing protein
MNSVPGGFNLLIQRADDPDAQVRLQVAYSLGQAKGPHVGRALARLALKDGADPYVLAAVLSSVQAHNLEPMLLAVVKESKTQAPPAQLLDTLFRMAIAQGNTRVTVALLRAITATDQGKTAPWQYAALAGFLEALDRTGSSLEKLQKEPDQELRDQIKQVSHLLNRARLTVAAPKPSPDKQLIAVRLLGWSPSLRQEDMRLLGKLLTPQTPAELQAAAITQLGRLHDRQVPQLLLRGWKRYGPGLRTQALDALLARPDWTKAVLDAVQAKKVLPFEIDAARRQRLLDSKNAAVRQRAATLLAGAGSTDRGKVVDSYRAALKQTGDSARGQEVFKRTCSACHKLGGIGQEVGPDLAALRDKSGEALLIAILDPNQAVEARYISYLATTKNGVSYMGLLASETGNSVVLIGADGKKHEILRTELEDLVSTGKSTIPEGLEKDINLKEMGDLLAFLHAHTPQPKRKVFEGNQPQLVKASAGGSLKLLPSNCEIYGPSLTLEKQYGNLGLWHSPDDHAVWTLDVPRAGKYAVWIDWACDNSSAGNRFELRADGQVLTGRVETTGNWDTYREARVGTITLRAGRQRVVFRSAGAIRGALIDLRGLRLVPGE